MRIDRPLLVTFLRAYPFRPATAFWRAIEIAHVLAHPFPEGFGLDLGCGDGALTRIILNALGETRSLVGSDIDPLETEVARQANVYQRIHTVPGDAIPEEDATFNFVFSNSRGSALGNVPTSHRRDSVQRVSPEEATHPDPEVAGHA